MKIGKDGPRVSHLMFADDLILFGATTEKQIYIVPNTLKVFCQVSSQRVSMEKSNITFRHGNRASRGQFLPPSNPNPNPQIILVPRPKPIRGWRIKTQTRPKRVRVGFRYPRPAAIHLVKSNFLIEIFIYFQNKITL